MPSNDDRRAHDRVPVRLVVHFSMADKPYRLVSENLSLGGIFLRGADAACQEGDVVNLEIVVPAEEGGAEGQHAVRGVVVQRVRGIGAGVRFDWDESRAAARRALEDYIERVGMLNSGAIHSEYVGLATDAVEER